MARIHHCAEPAAKTPYTPLPGGLGDATDPETVTAVDVDIPQRLLFVTNDDVLWVAVWFRDAQGLLTLPPNDLSIAVLPVTVAVPPAGGAQPLATDGNPDLGVPAFTYDARPLRASWFALRSDEPGSSSSTLPLHSSFGLPNGNSVAVHHVTATDPTLAADWPASLLDTVRVFRIEPSAAGLAARAPITWGVYVAGAGGVNLVVTTQVVSGATSVNDLRIPWLEVRAPSSSTLVLAPGQAQTVSVPIVNRGTGDALISRSALSAAFGAIGSPVASFEVGAEPSVLDPDDSDLVRVTPGAQVELTLSFTAHATDTGSVTTPPVPLGPAWTNRPPPTAFDVTCAFEESIAPITVRVASTEVVLVLDRSGSMAWLETSNGFAVEPNRRWDHLELATDTFIDGYYDTVTGTVPSGQLGIVTFSSASPGNAELLLPMQPVVTDLNTTAKDLIHAQTPAGNTPMRAGLQLALDQISDAGTPGGKWVVLLSDGDQNVGDARGVFAASGKEVNLIAIGYGPNAPQTLLQSLVTEVQGLGREAVRLNAVRRESDADSVTRDKSENVEALRDAFLEALSGVADFSGLALDPVLRVTRRRQIIELPAIDESHLRVHVWVSWKATVPAVTARQLELILVTPLCEEIRVGAEPPGVRICTAEHHVLFALSPEFLDGLDGRPRRGTYRLALRLRSSGEELDTMFVSWEVRARTEVRGGQLALEAAGTVAGEKATLSARVLRTGALRAFGVSAVVTAPTDTWDNWVIDQRITREEFAKGAKELEEQGITEFFELLGGVLAARGVSFRERFAQLSVGLQELGQARFAGELVPSKPGTYSVVATARGESLRERAFRADAQAQFSVGARVDPARTRIDFEFLDDDEALVHFWFVDRLGNRVWRDAANVVLVARGASFVDEGIQRDPELKSTYRHLLFGSEGRGEVLACVDGEPAGGTSLEPPQRLLWCQLFREHAGVKAPENALGPFKGAQDPAADVAPDGGIVLARERPLHARALTVFTRFAPSAPAPSFKLEVRFLEKKGGAGPWVPLGTFERRVVTVDLERFSQELLLDVRFTAETSVRLQALGFAPASKEPPRLGDFPIYGSQAVKLADRVRVLGQDGKGYAPVAKGGVPGGETNVGVEAETGAIFSRAPVVLRDRSHVFGSVSSTHRVRLGEGAKVEGAIEELSSFELPELPSIEPVPGSGKDVPVRGKESLPPANYGHVQVFKGGELTLAPGVYAFQSLLVEPGATIVLPSADAPLLIQIDDRFYLRGELVAAGKGRPNPLVTYAGAEQVSIEQPFFGTLVAPHARIVCGGTAKQPHFGSFFGREVELRPDVVVCHQPMPAAVVRALGEQARTSLRLKLSGVRLLRAVLTPKG